MTAPAETDFGLQNSQSRIEMFEVISLDGEYAELADRFGRWLRCKLTPWFSWAPSSMGSWVSVTSYTPTTKTRDKRCAKDRQYTHLTVSPSDGKIHDGRPSGLFVA